MDKAHIIKSGPPGHNILIAADIQMLLFPRGCYHPVFYCNTPRWGFIEYSHLQIFRSLHYSSFAVETFAYLYPVSGNHGSTMFAPVEIVFQSGQMKDC